MSFGRKKSVALSHSFSLSPFLLSLDRFVYLYISIAIYLYVYMDFKFVFHLSLSLSLYTCIHI